MDSLDYAHLPIDYDLCRLIESWPVHACSGVGCQLSTAWKRCWVLWHYIDSEF